VFQAPGGALARPGHARLCLQCCPDSAKDHCRLQEHGHVCTLSRTKSFQALHNLRCQFCLQVFGISGDSPAENKAFKTAQNLQYDLLSDADNILRKEFGIKNAMLVLPGRQTYVIDKSGKCIMSFNDMVNTSKHISEALKALGAS
jgi:peroxiredoxin